MRPLVVRLQPGADLRRELLTLAAVGTRWSWTATPKRWWDPAAGMASAAVGMDGEASQRCGVSGS